MLPAIDDAFALERAADLCDSLVQRLAAYLGAVVGRDLLGDAGEHAVDDLPARGAADLGRVQLLEVAEEARQQLQVGAAGQLLAALRGEEQQRRPADAVALLPDVDQAVGAQAVEVTAHGLLAQIERVRASCATVDFAMAADVAQNLLSSAFHVSTLGLREGIVNKKRLKMYFCC